MRGRRTGGTAIEGPAGDAVSVAAPVVLADVTVVADGTPILADVDWRVEAGQQVALLGPNGAGKTTVLQLLAGYRHPHRGTVDVLGERIGRVDVRALRRRIGIVSDGLGDLVDRRSALRPLVAANLQGRTTAAGARLTADELDRAERTLERVGIAHLGDRAGTTVSEGEWKRTLLARALVGDPDLLLLDEPCNGLDLAERERFLADLDGSLRVEGAPTAVLVTHHLEHVPPAVTHALLLREGRTTAAGPIDTAVTDATVSEAFGVEVEVTRRRGRLWAVPTDRVAASHPSAHRGGSTRSRATG